VSPLRIAASPAAGADDEQRNRRCRPMAVTVTSVALIQESIQSTSVVSG
jgi:hypothetical protein